MRAVQNVLQSATQPFGMLNRHNYLPFGNIGSITCTRCLSANSPKNARRPPTTSGVSQLLGDSPGMNDRLNVIGKLQLCFDSLRQGHMDSEPVSKLYLLGEGIFSSARNTSHG